MIKYIILALVILASSCRKSDYYIDNKSVIEDLGGGTGTTTWTNDKSYILDGFVFVNDGQTLTIEPGTVIRAKTGQASLASALIVARGGTIIAQGTSEDPIIFTVEGDDLEGSVPFEAQGLWGGVIILGNAPVNTPGGENFIEGIPISEPRGIYGGANDDDNSGIFQYVSIRHSGTKIGEGNEINGLTLGGIGKKTIISHVEVISSADDGIEFFGGTVNCKNLVSAYCGDDAFDFDEGYSGKCQFLLAIMKEGEGNHAAEHNGAPNPGTVTGFSDPVLYNCTYIGNNRNNNYLISFDYTSLGSYRNSIFLNSKKGVSLEYSPQYPVIEKMKTEKLLLSNNLFHGVEQDQEKSMFRILPLGNETVTESDSAYIVSYFENYLNLIDNPGLNYTSEPFNLLPSSTVFTQMADYTSEWFEEVNYKGAFGSNNWLEGWSAVWESEIIE